MAERAGGKMLAVTTILGRLELRAAMGCGSGRWLS
jgi:hypothetical protein